MKHIKLIPILAFLILSSINVTGQIAYDGEFGKGIKFNTEDDSFYLKFTSRIQTRWDLQHENGTEIYENKAFLKRARLKFDGYFINKNLRYKFEYDVKGGYVRDALVKYKMGNFDLWFGQGKLPGNRERIVSSANLQFVDRSIYNGYFNLDRDVGIQLHHGFNIGTVHFKEAIALTSGGGILRNSFNNGFALTGKFEILPFGKFTNKGDYISADIFREETPKLSIAAYSSYSKNAYKSMGTIGEVLDINSNLLHLGADLIFKYSGYSLNVEYGNRNSNSPAIDPTTGLVTGYYIGKGFNVQSGYVTKSMWELSARYSSVNPDQFVIEDPVNDYTLGLSKYIVGNSFKIQADVTYRENMNTNNMYIARIQVELQL